MKADSTDITFLAICTSLFLLGLLMLIGGANWIVNVRAYSDRAITTTSAVTAVREDYDTTSSPPRMYYWATVTFEHDGQTVTVESRSAGEDPIGVGDTLEVLYDPNDLNMAHAPADNFSGLGGALTIAIVTTAFGVLFTLVAGGLTALTIAGIVTGDEDGPDGSDEPDV